MGLLSMFKKDWIGEMQRVESYLEDGEPVLALELLRKIERRVDNPDHATDLKELRSRAETALLASLIQRADQAEAEGKLEDAVDWLLSAIERADDSSQLSALERRRSELLRRLEDDINPFGSGAGPEQGALLEELDNEDIDFHYDALVQTLAPGLAERYADRPVVFREAVLRLNGGQAEAALESLESMVEDDPEDAVLRLERGRAYLILGDNVSARADFEAIWNILGTDPLDAAGVLSIPSLWADSTLADDPAAVVDRLEELADPRRGESNLCDLYASALVEVQRHDQAIPYLQAVLRRFPSDPRFALHLANVLEKTGQPDEAVACLEASVGPSCSGGQCGVGPRYLPSLRALASLHLQGQPNLERCAELMAIVAQSQRGLLNSEDHRVLAQYYEASGDGEAAEHARAEANRLATLGPAAESAPTNLGGQRSAL
jgi:tetratricopeptide (TPR) repeat protein